MRRFIRTLALAVLCGAISCPILEARGRNEGNHGGGNGNRPTPARMQQNNNARPSRAQDIKPVAQAPNNNGGMRPGNGGQGGNNQGMRPGNNGQGPGNNSGLRPGNNGNGQGNNQGGRPGNNGNGGGNPGFGNGNQGGNPGAPAFGGGGGNIGNPGGPAFGGGNPGNPGHGNPGHGPGHRPNGWHGDHYRPFMPVPRPYTRPVPPASYVPMGGPSIATILGIAIGTTLNITLNKLLMSGYNVTGYGNNEIYVSNVNQLNLLWPNATLYYNNMGGLAASQYAYSTPYYDMSRYNITYNRLVNVYGVPVSTNTLANGGISCTWWGANGQYVTLNYEPEYAANGTMRYYTTLSLGI